MNCWQKQTVRKQPNGRKGGFVLILLVLSVTTFVAVLLTSVSLYIYPLLDISYENKIKSESLIGALNCKEIFLRNMGMNFDYDTLPAGFIYFKFNEVECQFDSSRVVSAVEYKELFGAATTVSQYGEHGLVKIIIKNKSKTSNLLSLGDASVRETILYLLIQKDLFNITEIQSFIFY